MKRLTKAQKKLIRDYLKDQFPWLGTDEEDVSGADTVQQLDDIYEALKIK